MNTSVISLLGPQEEPARGADKPIFYDLERRRNVEEPTSKVVSDALKRFTGSVRAVRRSTGGLVVAEPYQLIVYGDPMSHSQQPAFRIRVRFRDFKRGPGPLVMQAEYVTHTKTVTPEDLRVPFKFDTTSGPEGEQRYLLDFGHGTLPVHVYAYGKDPSGIIYAYFIELADQERLAKSKLGTRIPVQAFRVERNVLRYAMDDAELGMPLEYLFARDNYRKLRQEYARVIPEAFKVGSAVTIPAGIATADLRHFLAPTVRKHDETAPLCFTLDEEDGLKPFGLFEG